MSAKNQPKKPATKSAGASTSAKPSVEKKDYAAALNPMSRLRGLKKRGQ